MTSEELLIDFCELIGAHSGENLAHAIYDTLNIYNLKGCRSPQFVHGFYTSKFTIYRLLPLIGTMPQIMTLWLNTWRHCYSMILLNLIPHMSECDASLIQSIWRCWRYARHVPTCYNIEIICLAFESDWCGQRQQKEHLSRLYHCSVEQGAWWSCQWQCRRTEKTYGSYRDSRRSLDCDTQGLFMNVICLAQN